MNDWKETYDISGGDTTIILLKIEKVEHIVSLQIDTDAAFNGTNTKARLLQSNRLGLDISKWHPLPEGFLSLPTGADSALLCSTSFMSKYIAIEVDAGNASAGILQFTSEYKK